MNISELKKGYSIPQKKWVTKQNAKDLSRLVQQLEVYKTRKLTGSIIHILFEDDIKEIDKLDKIAQEPTGPATRKQLRALYGLIYGRKNNRTYTVETYLALMEKLTSLEDITYYKQEIKKERSRIIDLDEAKKKTEEKNKARVLLMPGKVEQLKRRKQDDPVYMYNEVILPFLKNLAHDFKTHNIPEMNEYKEVFVNELLNIVQATT